MMSKTEDPYVDLYQSYATARLSIRFNNLIDLV